MTGLGYTNESAQLYTGNVIIHTTKHMLELIIRSAAICSRRCPYSRGLHPERQAEMAWPAHAYPPARYRRWCVLPIMRKSSLATYEISQDMS